MKVVVADLMVEACLTGKAPNEYVIEYVSATSRLEKMQGEAGVANAIGVLLESTVTIARFGFC